MGKNRASRKEAKRQKKADKRASKLANKESRRAAKIERKRIKQEGKTSRVTERQDTKQTAYEHGMDPNDWIKVVAKSGAAAAIGIAGAKAIGKGVTAKHDAKGEVARAKAGISESSTSSQGEKGFNLVQWFKDLFGID